eukprot:jgi/Mesvir1/6523/Mv16788-RA.1
MVADAKGKGGKQSAVPIKEDKILDDQEEPASKNSHTGTIFVHIKHAKDLPVRQYVGEQDPYFRLSVGAKAYRSKTHTDGGANPTWNEAVSYHVSETVKEAKLEVWNSNSIIKHVLLGECCIDLTPVFKSRHVEDSQALYLYGKQKGFIFYSITFTPLEDGAAPPSPSTSHSSDTDLSNESSAEGHADLADQFASVPLPHLLKKNVPDDKAAQLEAMISQTKKTGYTSRMVNGVALIRTEDSAGTKGMMKASTVVRAPAEDVFKLVTNINEVRRWAVGVSSSRVVERIDKHMSIAHIVLEPLESWPFSLWPRDLCLLQYWRREDDGSYVVLMHSTTHPKCPELPGHVRAIMTGGGYTITPRKAKYAFPDGKARDCLVTYVVEGYTHMPRVINAWRWALRLDDMTALQATHVACIREAAEQSQFINSSMSAVFDTPENNEISVRAHAIRRAMVDIELLEEEEEFWETGAEVAGQEAEVRPVAEDCCVAKSMWEEGDVVGISVRGASYLTNRLKMPAPRPEFVFVGMDLCGYHGGGTGFLAHRPELMLGKTRERAAGKKLPFMFIVNMAMPTAKKCNLLMYFCPRGKLSLDDLPDTPFGRSLRGFVTGTDNDRNNVFKLIPKVVTGSWVIKQTVGGTPTLLGHKVTTKYNVNRAENYAEVLIDVGSSSVAAWIMKKVTPVAKELVVDLFFVLQGDTDETLPESILGAVRFKNMDLDQINVNIPAEDT